MITVSQEAMNAVMEKAKQSGMEDFSADFMAELRLENKELHTAVEGLLNNYLHSVIPSVDIESFFGAMSDDGGPDMDAIKDIGDSMSKFIEMAEHGKMVTICTLGVLYKVLKAELEGQELED